MNAHGRSFIHILYKYISNKNIFPFHLFIYNPKSGKYHVFLEANTPLCSEKSKDLKKFLLKKGSLAIDINQKQTFLRYIGIDLDAKEKNFIDSIKKQESKNIKIQQIKNQLKNKLRSMPPVTIDEIEKALLTENFSRLIVRAKIEFLAISSDESPEKYYIGELAKRFLTHDNQTNRIVALGLFLAKITKSIENEEILAKMGTILFISSIGLSQTLAQDRKYIREHGYNLHKKQWKHLLLTEHLIKKLNIDIPQETINILKEVNASSLNHKDVNDPNYFLDIVFTALNLVYFSKAPFSKKPISFRESLDHFCQDNHENKYAKIVKILTDLNDQEKNNSQENYLKTA